MSADDEIKAGLEALLASAKAADPKPEAVQFVASTMRDATGRDEVAAAIITLFEALRVRRAGRVADEQRREHRRQRQGLAHALWRALMDCEMHPSDARRVIEPEFEDLKRLAVKRNGKMVTAFDAATSPRPNQRIIEAADQEMLRQEFLSQVRKLLPPNFEL